MACSVYIIGRIPAPYACDRTGVIVLHCVSLTQHFSRLRLRHFSVVDHSRYQNVFNGTLWPLLGLCSCLSHRFECAKTTPSHMRKSGFPCS